MNWSLRRRAGIAQLVEQATENRRVPVQIWVLASTDAESVVSSFTTDSATDREIDKADSLAM